MLQNVFLSQCYGFYCVEVARKLLNFLMKQFVVAMHWKLTFYLFFKPLLCTTAMHGQYNILFCKIYMAQFNITSDRNMSL